MVAAANSDNWDHDESAHTYWLRMMATLEALAGTKKVVVPPTSATMSSSLLRPQDVFEAQKCYKPKAQFTSKEKSLSQ